MNRAQRVAKADELIRASVNSNSAAHAALLLAEAHVHAILAHSAFPMVLVVENGADVDTIKAAMEQYTAGVAS